MRGGADLIELGVPFSDPIADGPVIQRGGERALKAGTTLRGVLEIAAQIRETSEVPLLLFTYLNPVMRYGLDRLAEDAARCGIDGCLLTTRRWRRRTSTSAPCTATAWTRCFSPRPPARSAGCSWWRSTPPGSFTWFRERESRGSRQSLSEPGGAADSRRCAQ